MGVYQAFRVPSECARLLLFAAQGPRFFPGTVVAGFGESRHFLHGERLPLSPPSRWISTVER